jgi:hypothetical protein
MPREGEDGMNKRHVSLGQFAGLAGASVLSAFAMASEVTEADASAAIMVWLGALASRDPATVEKVLAPEFQILRSDGSGYDRSSYLGHLPNFTGKPEIQDLVFSSGAGLLVTRYNLRLEQKIGDKPVQALAPRLSVLRREGAGWLMVAHANFAQIG